MFNWIYLPVPIRSLYLPTRKNLEILPTGNYKPALLDLDTDLVAPYEADFPLPFPGILLFFVKLLWNEDNNSILLVRYLKDNI